MKQRFPLNRRTERRAAAHRRDNLVRRVRTRFVQTSWRLHLYVIITLAGVAAFLTSLVALRLGLSSMALRYPLAVAAGYLAFLVLIRGWIAWQRGSLDRLGDVAGDAVSNLDLSDRISPGSLATDGGYSAAVAVVVEVAARIGRAHFHADVRRAARRVGLTSVWISMSSGRCSWWRPARLADLWLWRM